MNVQGYLKIGNNEFGVRNAAMRQVPDMYERKIPAPGNYIPGERTYTLGVYYAVDDDVRAHIKVTATSSDAAIKLLTKTVSGIKNKFNPVGITGGFM